MGGWVTPQLVELVQGRPDEAILASCKDNAKLSGSLGQPSTAFRRCVLASEPGGGLAISCGPCQDLSTS